MTQRIHALAAYVGQSWVAIMGLAFIPLYVKTMGISAWGVVGFVMALQAWTVLLEMGFGQAINREISNYIAGKRNLQSICDLIRTLELILCSIATIMVIALWMCAPILSRSWLNLDGAHAEAAETGLKYIGIIFAAKMVEQLYRGAVQGLQRFVSLNFLQALMATVRWGGGVVVISTLSPTLEVFFAWQATVSIFSLLAMIALTYRSIPSPPRLSRFNRGEYQSVLHFSGGLTMTAALVALVTQLDKLILSRYMALEQLGYYALATMVSGAMFMLVGPLTSVVGPRLNKAAANGDLEELARIYRNATQWAASLLVVPIVVIAVYSEKVLWAWTGDNHIASNTSHILSILCVGALLNGLMQVPYMLQLSIGWTGLAIRLNLIAAVVIVPLLIWIAPRYGGEGAAWVWVLINSLYVFAGIRLMHRRILNHEKKIWYVHSMFLPTAASAIVVLTSKYIVSDAWISRFDGLIYIMATGVAAQIIVSAITPAVRAYYIHVIGFLWSLLRNKISSK